MADQIIPGWYDTPGAMKKLGVSRDAISKIAKNEEWQSVPKANGHLHRAEDVHEYRAHQVRGKLARKLGWKAVGRIPIYRVDDIDISCPFCEGFAVQWPAPPYLAEKYLCVNDHEGKLE